MFSMSHCAPGDAYYLQETGIKSAAAGFGKAAFGLRGGFARANAGGADEQFGRDLQMLVQAANHLQRQWAASAQDLVDAGPAADDSRERFCIRPPLLQAKLDRLDGVLRIDVKMSALIASTRSTRTSSLSPSRVPSPAPHRLSISVSALLWSSPGT